MTDKQKAAFLRSEGWKRYKVSDGTYGIDGWRDTKEKHVLESLAPLDMAYRLASRRKSARDRRRLVKAGYWACNEGGYHFGGLVSTCLPKSEALKLLEAGNG